MPVHKAIGSRKNFTLADEDELLSEYKECVADLLENDMVSKMDQHVQHCNTSRLQHCINVSYYSFLICYRMGWDYRSAARAGLLHDLYFYDWRIKKSIRSNHASWHPRIALDNAKKITEINPVEKDAIVKHMWPCTLVPPRYVESYVVTLADKACAMVEVTERKYQKMKSRKPAVL